MTSKPDNLPANPSRVVQCPTCGKPVPWAVDSRFRPFCSARCKSIDFGAWAAEEYRVAQRDGQPTDDDA